MTELILDINENNNEIAILLENGEIHRLFENNNNSLIPSDIIIFRLTHIVKGLNAGFGIAEGVEPSIFAPLGDFLPLSPALQADTAGLCNAAPAVNGRLLAMVNTTNKKHPKVSGRIILHGRILIASLLNHDKDNKKMFFSRRITNEEKEKISNIVQEEIKNSPLVDYGIIVRSSILNYEEEVLRQILKRDVNTISNKINLIKSQLQVDTGLIFRQNDFSSFIINNILFKYKIAKIYIAPTLLTKYSEELALGNFDVQIIKPGSKWAEMKNEVNRLLQNKIIITKGDLNTSLYIREDEITTIDVNATIFSSGKENILKANIMAAREIARQLRLRDLGGLIVIDFIDMDDSDKAVLYEEFKNLILRDEAKVDISPISKFSVIEVVRQRGINPFAPAKNHTSKISLQQDR